jgi:5'(3')-deoxyribonucleotidase
VHEVGSKLVCDYINSFKRIFSGTLMKIWVSDSKIGVDLDDVAFDLVGGLAEFHNKNWGTSLKKEDFSSYRFYNFFGCSEEEATKRVDSFLDSEYFDELKPLEGAVAGINRLIEERNKIFIVTSRHERLTERTRLQLERHFPALVDAPCDFTGNAYTGQGMGTKEAVCRREGLRYMIEDSPIYAEQCSRYMTVLLMVRPWNRKLAPEGRIFEINGWADINRVPR